MSNDTIQVPIESFRELKRLAFALTRNVEKVYQAFSVPETAVNVLTVKDQFLQLFRFIDKVENAALKEGVDELEPFPDLEEVTDGGEEGSDKLDAIVQSFENIMCWKIQGLEREMNLFNDAGIVVHVSVDNEACDYVFTLTEGPDIPQYPMESTQIIAAWEAKSLACKGTWLVGGRIKHLYELAETATTLWENVPDKFFLANYPTDDSRWDSMSEDFFMALDIDTDAEDFDVQRRAAVELYILQEEEENIP